MPIGFTSAARNLFLLGSAGADLVTNFFKTIDQSSTTDGVFTARDIKYLYSEERYLLAGLALNSQGKSFGFHEKRQENGTEDWSVKTQSTDPANNVTLTSLELDSNGNLLVGGLANNAPWIARYTTAGVLQWTSTTNTGNGRYFGLAVDSDDNYYGAGRTKRNNPLITDDGYRSSAILEKYDNNGNTIWGKSVAVTGENVCFNKVDATSTSIIAAGYLGDGIGKGYLAKFDKSNGEMQWDRTIVSNVKTDLGVQEQTSIEDIHVDPDGNIYLCGTLFLADSEDDTEKKGRGFVIKYSAEGNLLWQKEVGVPGLVSYYQYYNISVDDNTRQVVVFGRTYNASATYGAGLLTKLSSSGEILWNRRLLSDRVPPTLNHFSRRSGFDADPSFYYVFFTDDNTNLLNGTPDEYTFGRVSSSGNGLGDFQYEPQTGINIDYEIINPSTRIGKLQDGSIRNDSSDLTSYPFSALKVSFDDYATPITNKKAILSDKDLVQRSGSPAIRPVDFMELDLGDERFDVFVPAQEELYDQVGTYGFEVPAGVTEVSAVAIGGGGGAAFCTGSNASSAGGGGGGGTAWGTFTVTPGETLTVVVGTGGMGGEFASAIPGASGGDSTISRGGTVLLNGGGGAGGVADAPATNSSFGTAAAGGTSTGSERDGGGAGGLGGHPRYNFGGGGGGGAGGYNGTGGNGGSGNSSGTTPQGGQGTGGGGGGGGGQGTQNEQNNGGGGIGIYGGPINGAGGAIDSPGNGGSNGQGGQSGGRGGLFGGGGGGREDDTSGAGGTGGSGGVRIIWGAGRSFPDNAQRDLSSTETRVRDKSGKGNDGVVNGPTLDADGYWEFDGTDDNIVISKDDFTSTNNIDFSIESWFYFDSLPTLPTSKGYIWDQSPGSGGIAFRASTAGDLTTFAYPTGGGGVVLTNSGVTLQTGRWYHAVSVFETNKVSLYVDGVLSNVTNATIASVADVGNTDFFIGCAADGGNGNGSEFMDGRIGEFRIYPRVLTEAQVFQNYNATKSKYINEAPSTAPRIGPGIVNDSNLILNYDFGNRATYDSAENLIPESEDLSDITWTSFPITGAYTDEKVLDPFGFKTAIVPNFISARWGLYDHSNGAWFSGYQDGQLYPFTVTDTWQRQSITFTVPSGSTAVRFYPMKVDIIGGVNTYYLATGLETGATYTASAYYKLDTDGETVICWGCQMNKGSLDRYIKTYGTAITAPITVNNLSSTSYTGTIDATYPPTFNADGYFDFGTTSQQNLISTTGTNCSTLLGTTDSGGSCTMECWALLDDTFTRQTILSGYTSGDSMRWDLEVSSGNLQFIRHANGSTSGTGGVSAFDWSHIVVTRGDGADARIRIYLNGSEVGTSLLGGPLGSGVPLGLGMRADGSTDFPLDGKIAEVRTYTRFLSATEVSQNYNATRGKYGV